MDLILGGRLLGEGRHVTPEIYISRSMMENQQPQYVGPMLIQWWATVEDGGPPLDQHMANVLCLLGSDGVISLYSGHE